MKIFLTIACCLFLFVSGAFIVKIIQYNQNCGGYLKRASNANTIELAAGELSLAIKYMEDNNLTSGYTSVLWKTPNEDIGFWYNNVKTSLAELQALSDTASPLEKSNMLIKLRETLTDAGKDGSYVTDPNGISRYPNNVLWGILMWFSVLGIIAGFIWLSIELS